ncbi:TPA: hypothetical protein JBJ22_12345 [Legionella pneumophila]|nr:hypothetical protein [Legionella pneumophila]HBD7092936.1 hypothetical protein [Legionella pneumophila]HBD9280499.1 hypothetical protein [Legionella pneumophila]
MNYLLAIKQDLLLTPMAGPLPAISNQQSAISTRFSLIFILLHYILLCFFPLFRVLLHLLAPFAARSCIHSHVIPIDCR